MVMAPTAISPPYRSRDELKQTVTILSLDCMIKAASPSAIQGRTTFASRWRCIFPEVKLCLLPQRNKTTQSVEIACEITVASAAPRTPYENKIIQGLNNIADSADQDGNHGKCGKSLCSDECIHTQGLIVRTRYRKRKYAYNLLHN